MSIGLNHGKTVRITEGSLPHLAARHPHLNGSQMLRFMELARTLCVDCFEVDEKVLRALKKLPEALPLIYRIRSPSDLPCFFESRIRRCVLDEKAAAPGLMSLLKGLNKEIVLECRLRTYEECGRIFALPYLHLADIIRVSGISEIKGMHAWTPYLASGTLLEINPSNTLQMATSIAVDAALSGAGSLFLTFSGLDSQGNGFAATEEVVSALLLLTEQQETVSLKELKDLACCFESLSGIPISRRKPLLGKDIFKYESGIHADGIRKDPRTYEPYPPEWVGLARELVIGKHSGGSSVIQKLKEAGISVRREAVHPFLDHIRQYCSEHGRSLSAEELAQHYHLLFGLKEGRKCTKSG